MTPRISRVAAFEQLECRVLHDIDWSGSAEVWDTTEDWPGSYLAPAQLISVDGTADTSLGITSLEFSGGATFNFDEGGGYQSFSLRGGAGFGFPTDAGTFNFDIGVTYDPGTDTFAWGLNGEFNGSKAGGFSDVAMTFHATEGGSAFTVGFPGISGVSPSISINMPDEGEVYVGFYIGLSFSN